MAKKQSTQNKVRRNSSDKTLIGVSNDEMNMLLRGGFALPHDFNSGLVVLIKGKPGTGKSTLALHLLETLKANTKCDRRFYSVEQTERDIQYKAATMLVAQAIEASERNRRENGQLMLSCDKEQFFAYFGKKSIEISDNFQLDDLTITLEAAETTRSGAPPKRERELLKRNRIATQLASDILSQIEGYIAIYVPQKISPPEAHTPFREARSDVAEAHDLLAGLVRDFKTENRDRRPFVVVDGLSVLSQEDRRVLRLERLVEILRMSSQIGFLVYEPSTDESEILDHRVDMVVELSEHLIEDPMEYVVHNLSIRKSRYQATALGRHQFKIRTSGLELYPSIHFQVHRPRYMNDEYHRALDAVRLRGETGDEKESISSGSLIDLLVNGVKEGDSVALLGPRGTFKTAISLDFLIRGSWGCPREHGTGIEDGLLISLIDNAEDIHRGLSCPLADETKKCTDCFSSALAHMFAFYQRPGFITPAEFMTTIRHRIVSDEKCYIRRIVFWDLTQLDYRFPLFRNDTMFLPAMLDLFKRYGLKSVFMGAGNAHYTAAASAMADNVVFCWRDRLNKKDDSKNSTVQKKNDSKNSTDQEKEFLMVYVDRTAGRIGREGRALYKLEIEGNKVKLPESRKKLDRSICRADEASEFDVTSETVTRIIQLQGV